MSKPKTKRLPKGPISQPDYVIEEIWGNQERILYNWSVLRSRARAFAKQSSADRVRVFKVGYKLEMDKKK